LRIFVRQAFPRWTRYPSPWDSLAPIREELFSIERLEEHASSLAVAQTVTPTPLRGHKLAKRLADNATTLLDAYRSMATAIEDGRPITPAAEWLLDNYHLIEKQVHEIRSDLPPGYYRQLPKLATGPFAGYPRVFGVAWAFVAHTDSRFDSDMMLRYLLAYQQVQPLTIGELWAVSVTLRIVLIENLRRLAQRIMESRVDRETADALADRLFGAAGRTEEPVAAVLADVRHQSLSEEFAVQLVYRLRDQDARIAPALIWLDQRLAGQHTSADAVVRDVHRAQGASNVSVRNIITSLRLISTVDWNEAFERASLVDGVLGDGSGFKAMDFPTRNLYRSAIEELARGSGRSELDIAHTAVRSANGDASATSSPTDDRRSDPGYHLIAGGRWAFEDLVGFRRPWSTWPARLNRAFGVSAYATAIGLVTAILLALPLLALGWAGAGWIWLVGIAALGAIPAGDAAVALINRGTAFGFSAAPLPALELLYGVPASLRTLVAVPTLLTTPAAIEEQIERLEIHHLASPDGNLHFALLSDWTDSRSEHEDRDDALLAAAVAGIARLNARYAPAEAGARFLLLHRRRVWNEGEARWMGWERKRGKLHELNRLLRGATDTTFVSAAWVLPADTRYVVTLDADTRLPRDTVRRLIGKMAHPLNRPRFDAETGRVVEGYAVLQPRVTPSLPVGPEGSLFQRIFSSLSGIDPYTFAVSDVYQDLFGEGSYAGKGIYDVDAFEASLAGRVPESTLLSHDLFEGIFARAGLASDVEVIEEFPARYDAGASRHHRWARGDWQLLPWVLGRGPVAPGADRTRAAIPAIGRVKMLDNLRRSLSAPASILALLFGWSMPLPLAAVWTVFILATIVLPSLIPVVAAIPPRRPGVMLSSHVRALGGDLRLALALSALNVTFLADQAGLMGDAIARTLWRLFVTRRHLVEWVPAAQASLGPRLDLASCYRRMIGAPLIGALALATAGLSQQRSWYLAVPFAVLWVASPAVARWVSLSPKAAGQVPVSGQQARVLRRTARRTWRFFEAFVTPADHMLPPDNFQEDPAPVLAHRTSPTNIGLYLLSVVSAHDFGWIGTIAAVERLEATFATMRQMALFRGHFYNWYDTTDLRPLDPRYVSSVDSGNLAGHLLALANACREWKGRQRGTQPQLGGVADAVDLTRQEAARLRDGPLTQTVTWRQLDDALAGLARQAEAGPIAAETLARCLARLAEQGETMVDIAQALSVERGNGAAADLLFWAQASLDAIQTHRRDSVTPESLDARLATLEDTARSMALAMDFNFLLAPDRKLLSIGYLVPENTLDPNCYDLLASEARLASFVAIAKGDVPAQHWFRLGRSATPVGHGAALISWSGSMFEYLMPSLVMRAPVGSLLEQTNRLTVRRQIEYGTSLHLPWGMSESAYNARDLEFTYQYSNFGVPGLGLKRGLGENRVIAPYATALATMVDAPAAVANLERLAASDACGRYGFYEALDYTPTRVPTGETVAVVRAFMAHHQGMSIIAIADGLFDGATRARFHAEPIIQATELLLQERMPRDVGVTHAWAAEVKSSAAARDIVPSGGRRFNAADQPTPATHLLTNGRYSVMLTTAGSGYSRWGDLAVTRWREDATCDDSGSYVFLKDVQSGAVWSAGFQPSGMEPDEYRVLFNEDRAEFTRRDGILTTTLDVLVSAEDDAEVRRVTISNAGHTIRELEITSYAELVLTDQAADIAHPAFAKMFVQTEYLTDVNAIVATRRRRTPTEPEIWAAHLAVVDGETVGAAQIETDRARFLGRGHGVRAPIAMVDAGSLSNTVGTVLDPIFALRRRVRIPAGAIVRIAYWTVVAPTRAALLDNIDKHRDTTAFARAATLAWTQAQVQLYHLGITAVEAALFQRLAGHVIYTAPTLRPPSGMIQLGAGPQSGLWAQSISGDLPIVLLRIADSDDLSVARQLLQAHEYWRMKQLAVDLVILNDRQSSYVQDLQSALETLVRTSQSRGPIKGDGPSGRVVVLRGDLVPAETCALLASAARVVLVAQRGSLLDQFERIVHARLPAVHGSRRAPLGAEPSAPPPVLNLELFNGLGGFAEDGKEYVTILGPGQRTPAPWINVIANPAFGFQTSTEGSGYTWSVNSRENQLTPWSNDPVTDRSGEAFYLRDDDTGALWSPTALPIRDEAATYIARHGRGYTRFIHTAFGIRAELLQFVPTSDPIKISRLVLRNRTSRTRHLSVTAYLEWVLGPSRSASQAFVTTEIDPATGAMFARNAWNLAFGSRVAFADLRGGQTDWTGDRREFVGRNGTLASPAVLTGGARLSNKVGAGLDPCCAMRRPIELQAGGRVELVFFLGEAADANEARSLLIKFRSADLDAAHAAVTADWDAVLGAVQVKTPDRSLDIMLNGWLLYQTRACRVWARSAFYQASGAYGFRDQLQDGMALVGSCPGLVREHLLRAAGRQFLAGDVQHWWLPHSGQGVRGRISDDCAWLAYAVSHYASATGDVGVLTETIPLLEGQTLRLGEHDNFFQPATSDQTASLFEHCARALDQSLALGCHGLPLIGTGDWNDGLNRVGELGKGESVWLGWFLYAALTEFIPIADARGEASRAKTWRAHADALKASLEREAWDGDWYRRGFFDDGTPLGSATNDECRIDSIAQSWAVLSGAPDADRAPRAMAAVERDLIKFQDKLALLFAPPFNQTHLDPGYIKGYPPGLRENGGQYTHAALWMVMAFAALGQGDKAWSLLSLLNPINHARTRADVFRYKVEPYVVAADIYATSPHVGRGGWTWYTGSAGWMQRAGLESVLGLRLKGGMLHFDPCIPCAWPGFEIHLRHGLARYEIRVENPNGVYHGISHATINGQIVIERPFQVPLSDGPGTHCLLVRLG
jgi:cyclic beta-1,2-glucan synthetase